MFEYAISQGEGTLIEFGTFKDDAFYTQSIVYHVYTGTEAGKQITIERCSDDCETGQ